MRQRIDELQTTISQIVRRLKDSDFDVEKILQGIDLQAGSAAIVGRESLEKQTSETAFSRLSILDDLDTGVEQTPFVSFFESNILGIEKARFDTNSQNHSNEPFNSINGKYTSLMRRLEPLAPSQQLVSTIVQETCLTLSFLRSSFAELQRELSADSDESAMQSLRVWIVESFHSNDPARLCKALLLLVACIQQLRPNQPVGSLGVEVSMGALQKQYMDAADAFLTPDEGLVGSIDGVECLLFLVAFYLHAGLPRKAWILFRRAASFAQVWCSPTVCEDSRVLSIWMQLWQVDRSLSLLLGLPYMLNDFNVPLDVRCLPARLAFAFELGKIGAQVIDRNRTALNDMVYRETIQLEENLTKCKDLMPAEFWSIPPQNTMSTDSALATNTVHFWYHTLRQLIHLPFALNRRGLMQHELSRRAALESSREMLRIYQSLRNPKWPLLRQCDMLDFQALTAALIIIHFYFDGSLTAGMDDRQKDWQMIEDIFNLMHAVRQEMPDSVAAQATRLLEDVIEFHDSPLRDEDYYISLPYFGRLNVRHRPKDSLNDHPETASCHEGDAESRSSDWNDLSFHGNMDSFDQDWTSSIDFSLLDGWRWSGDMIEDL
jgi:hypothetical protein